jgi:hypothetical protein
MEACAPCVALDGRQLAAQSAVAHALAAFLTRGVRALGFAPKKSARTGKEVPAFFAGQVRAVSRCCCPKCASRCMLAHLSCAASLPACMCSATPSMQGHSMFWSTAYTADR